MKKLALSLIIVISLVVIVGFKSRLFPQRTKAPSNSNRQETLASTLTQAEEGDLQKLLSQTLLSMKTWDGRTGCSEVEGKELNLAETIKEAEAQQIEVRLDVRENSLIVYLDALRMYLVFPRLHDRGLAPPIDHQFCEKTYEDSVATQKQYPYFEHSKKDVRADPGMTAIVDRINEKYPSADYDKVTRQEVRKYLVPVLTAKAVEHYATWSEEKTRLYRRILEVIKREACLSLSYSPNYPVTATVPDFNIGDPAIYVLFEGRSYDSTSVEWVTFGRDLSNGQYTAEPAKNFGLPDEIKTFSPLIKKKQVRKVRVECSTK